MSNLPAPVSLSEADYEAIADAVMETARGRWFLAEYARRNRHADTQVLLAALGRIERAMQGGESSAAVDKVRFDIVEMAKAISRTKAEIASIKPDAEQHGKFGEATEELDSIVSATENATSDILAAAEQIQEIAWTLREQGLEGEVCDLVDTKATDIYTACSFQDITGQRTRKVINVLRYLEGRINAMIGIWGLEGALAAEARETETARQGETHLLNGPALPGQGLDQGDVDMVMGPAVQSKPPEQAEPSENERPANSTNEPAPQASARTPEPAAAELPAPVVIEPSPSEPIEAPPLQPVESARSESKPEPRPKPEPRRAPANDPLAPLDALSPEEKIALFS